MYIIYDLFSNGEIVNISFDSIQKLKTFLDEICTRQGDKFYLCGYHIAIYSNVTKHFISK